MENALDAGMIFFRQCYDSVMAIVFSGNGREVVL